MKRKLPKTLQENINIINLLNKDIITKNTIVITNITNFVVLECKSTNLKIKNSKT